MQLLKTTSLEHYALLAMIAFRHEAERCRDCNELPRVHRVPRDPPIRKRPGVSPLVSLKVPETLIMLATVVQ